MRKGTKLSLGSLIITLALLGVAQPQLFIDAYRSLCGSQSVEEAVNVKIDSIRNGHLESEIHIEQLNAQIDESNARLARWEATMASFVEALQNGQPFLGMTYTPAEAEARAQAWQSQYAAEKDRNTDLVAAREEAVQIASRLETALGKLTVQQRKIASLENENTRLAQLNDANNAIAAVLLDAGTSDSTFAESVKTLKQRNRDLRARNDLLEDKFAERELSLDDAAKKLESSETVTISALTWLHDSFGKSSN
jgi:chromosome segregation ATPase